MLTPAKKMEDFCAGFVESKTILIYFINLFGIAGNIFTCRNNRLTSERM